MNFESLLKVCLEEASLISIALNSFRTLGNTIRGWECLEVEVDLEKGTNRSRALRRAGPSCSSHLAAFVVHVLMNNNIVSTIECIKRELTNNKRSLRKGNLSFSLNETKIRFRRRV